MAIALVESQFGPTSTQNLQFDFFCNLCSDFFPIVVLLAGNVVLCQCHSIAHVHALYFLVKADLSDLFSRDKMDPGQKGSRTKWNQDKMDPGQDGSRTKGNQDNMDPGQYGTGTIGNHKDNREP